MIFVKFDVVLCLQCILRQDLSLSHPVKPNTRPLGFQQVTLYKSPSGQYHSRQGKLANTAKILENFQNIVLLFVVKAKTTFKIIVTLFEYMHFCVLFPLCD